LSELRKGQEESRQKTLIEQAVCRSFVKTLESDEELWESFLVNLTRELAPHIKPPRNKAVSKQYASVNEGGISEYPVSTDRGVVAFL
jgi:hypothetical protein